MKNKIVFIMLAMLVSVILIAGCAQPQTVVPNPQPGTAIPTSIQTTTAQPSDNIRLVNSSLGRILVDANGRTLYYFSTDIPGSGNSTCTSAGCLALWPVFNAGTIRVSAPLSASDFSVITRADGNPQTTYKGYPLYYYQNDTKPGDTNGEGILKVWFVVKPDYTVMVAQQKSLGAFLTDSNGKTLYYFTKDTPVSSACNGTCSSLWPPFVATPQSIPTLLKNTDFTMISREDGTKQLAYMGRPLYTYSRDTRPGDVNGQGFNNIWFVANVTGTVPAAATPASTTKPPTTPDYSSGSSGGGY